MQILLKNKKINLKYEVLATYTAGIALLGHEVKSLKTSQASMEGAYVTIQQDPLGKWTVTLRGLSIPPYQVNNQVSDSQERERVLLLNKREILEIERELHTKGVTVVPKAVGLSAGKVKVEIALVRGKKKYDKRQDIKKRDQQRDAERDSKARFS